LNLITREKYAESEVKANADYMLFLSLAFLVMLF
jgi:hypothetical protein